jgi:hypothetical protein
VRKPFRPQTLLRAIGELTVPPRETACGTACGTGASACQSDRSSGPAI